MRWRIREPWFSPRCGWVVALCCSMCMRASGSGVRCTIATMYFSLSRSGYPDPEPPRTHDAMARVASARCPARRAGSVTGAQILQHGAHGCLCVSPTRGVADALPGPGPGCSAPLECSSAAVFPSHLYLGRSLHKSLRWRRSVEPHQRSRPTQLLLFLNGSTLWRSERRCRHAAARAAGRRGQQRRCLTSCVRTSTPRSCSTRLTAVDTRTCPSR